MRQSPALGQRSQPPVLRSKGKPISIDENPFEEPSQRMAHHLLRVNGFAPPWIEEASEIDRECENLRDNLRGAHRSHAVNSPSWQRALDGFRRQAKELNRRIPTHNLKSPSAQFHKLQSGFGSGDSISIEALKSAGARELILPAGDEPIVTHTAGVVFLGPIHAFGGD
jgi:hypothetical protein